MRRTTRAAFLLTLLLRGCAGLSSFPASSVQFRPRGKRGRGAQGKGDTAAGRLRAIDEYLLLRERALLFRPPPPPDDAASSPLPSRTGVIVDLGVGEVRRFARTRRTPGSRLFTSRRIRHTTTPPRDAVSTHPPHNHATARCRVDSCTARCRVETPVCLLETAAALHRDVDERRRRRQRAPPAAGGPPPADDAVDAAPPWRVVGVEVESRADN